MGTVPESFHMPDAQVAGSHEEIQDVDEWVKDSESQKWYNVRTIFKAVRTLHR